MADNKAFVVELNDEKSYQRLIPGAPTTHGMKSGRVYLHPGESCGIHSTEDKEEQLVFLSGCGTAIIGEEEMVVGQGRICYIPPQTEHNILNTSTEPLVYVFCVTPVS